MPVVYRPLAPTRLAQYYYTYTEANFSPISVIIIAMAIFTIITDHVYIMMIMSLVHCRSKGGQTTLLLRWDIIHHIVSSRSRAAMAYTRGVRLRVWLREIKSRPRVRERGPGWGFRTKFAIWGTTFKYSRGGGDQGTPF